MAVTKLTDALIVAGQYNFTGQSNQVSFDYNVDSPESTVFGDTTHNFAPSLLTAKMKASGFWNAGAVPTQAIDPNAFSMIGGSIIPTLVAPVSTDGGPAYIFNSMQSRLGLLGKIGELIPYSLDSEIAASSTGVGGYATKSTILAPFASRTATVSGTATLLGAVSATQRLVASLHITAYATITNVIVTIKSSAVVGMTSPTTRLTFTTATGLTSELLQSALGPITDTYYQVTFTVTGAGSFSAIVACGVQSIV